MTTGTMFKMCIVGTAVAGLTGMTNQASLAAVSYSTRALTGQAAPGTAAGVTYSGFENLAVINSAGQTAFKASLTGTGVGATNDQGIWSGASGSLGLVARTGSAAPDTAAGVVYDSFNDLYINNAGQTAFAADISGPGVFFVNDEGLWSEGSGSLGLVSREDDPAPGTGAGVFFGGLYSKLQFNDAGQMAFWNTLAGAVNLSNNDGIWSEGSGSLGLVARKDDPAPGTGAGVVYEFLSNLSLNSTGQVAFNSSLTGTGVNTANNYGVWKGTTGSLSLVTRLGDAAPDTAAGVVHSDFFSSTQINDAGHIFFFSLLSGPGVDVTNDHGIWSDSSGSLSLVARSGDAAPGTAPGVEFSFISNNLLNNAGHVGIEAGLTGPGVDSTNDTGIWSADGLGSLSLVVREGDAAPGTGPGVVFTDLLPSLPFRTFSKFEFNDAGQSSFRGTLSGTGVDTTNDEGIWATDPAGQLTMVAREGDLFDVNDDPLIDDLRTITALDLNSKPFEHRSFNDAGQLVYWLGFTDGSEGIFVATISLTGDLDADGFVGITDLNLILGNWNQNVTPGDTLLGDASGDGFVGIEDLNTVLGNWNSGTPPQSGATVPEPSALILLATGSLSLVQRRRR